jgi:hypothetical protein
MDSELEPMLTIEQAASILGRSHWTLRLDARKGRIKTIRIGRNLMVDPSEVRFIRAHGLRRACPGK